jgi:hypothetical protein
MHKIVLIAFAIAASATFALAAEPDAMAKDGAAMGNTMQSEDKMGTSNMQADDKMMQDDKMQGDDKMHTDDKMAPKDSMGK